MIIICPIIMKIIMKNYFMYLEIYTCSFMLDVIKKIFVEIFLISILVFENEVVDSKEDIEEEKV